MKRVLAALVAVLSPCIALAQPMSHPHHGKPASPPASGDAAVRSTHAAVPATTEEPIYRSPFADYRPFSDELLPKDWRKANDEVREAGGHIGLVKGTPAQLQGRPAHGAKQPAPPASVERK